ncbi:hypothetical protein PUW24_17835 [Paenibacillus urinalis]|uniref:ABC transporter domain-containing protein n=1 Tax=Paenibacillus urinalis TaxID=521520 RepID=A0ABY7XHC3_9BACL|nr:MULTISPECIES: hypothetical protein [Paenibacillus]WDH96035.1 hypothetical protein PUW24_17835 [Paenibacillus urinalis]WDI04255.1 hypothetical protein PUW25_10010 [Paenibacillus urinalis]
MYLLVFTTLFDGGDYANHLPASGAGEGVVLTSHNGSGKRTLLRILAALLFPSIGEVIAWRDGSPIICTF